MDRPLMFRWEGDSFVPNSPFWAKKADEIYVVGQVYPLVEQQDRSRKSHDHYFAQVHQIWLNLPDAVAAEFPDAEHLRKHALIRCGYSDKRSIVTRSKIEAVRLAAFLRPIDTYAIVTIDARTVTQWTAQSQSYTAMGKHQFQESKDKVLEWCANLIGVAVEDLPQKEAA